MEKINIGYYHKNQTNMILDGCEVSTICIFTGAFNI